MMIIKKTLFFLLFFGPFLLLAQPSVRHLDLLSGDLSIVRNYTDEITISYTQDSPVTGYFVYDDGSGTVLKADMRQNCRVYDFEIYRDTLYFCGRYASGGTVFGFFGFFDISDLFFIGGSMNGTYCYYSNPSSPSEPDLYPTVPWRMDVFEYDGQVHIAAVGECRNWAPYGLQYNTSTSIYDVYFDGSSWNCEAFHIKPYETYFTDIVATDNNVVVTEMAAPENVFNHCQIRIFKQSSAFLNTPLNPSYYTTNVIDGTPVGKVVTLNQDGRDFRLVLPTCNQQYHTPEITEEAIVIDCE